MTNAEATSLCQQAACPDHRRVGFEFEPIGVDEAREELEESRAEEFAPTSVTVFGLGLVV